MLIKKMRLGDAGVGVPASSDLHQALALMGTKESIVRLFNAQSSTDLVNELGTFNLVMVSKRGAGGPNRLVLCLRDDVDTDAAASSSVHEPEQEPAAFSLNSQPAGLFIFASVFEEYFCYIAILASARLQGAESTNPVSDEMLPKVLQHVCQCGAGLTDAQRKLLSSLAEETPKASHLRMFSACPGGLLFFPVLLFSASLKRVVGNYI